MTTTADWLHLRLGTPLPDERGAGAQAGEVTSAEIIARQRALAAQPLAVTFLGR